MIDVKLDLNLKDSIKKLLSLDEITNKEIQHIKDIDETTFEKLTLGDYLYVINTYSKYLSPRTRQADVSPERPTKRELDA